MLLAFDTDSFWATEVLRNPVWKWAALFGLLLLAAVVGKIISFALDRHGRRLAEGDRGRAIGAASRALSKPIELAIIAIALHFGQKFLVLDVNEVNGKIVVDPNGHLRLLWMQIVSGLFAFTIAWAAFRLVDVLEHLLKGLTTRTETRLDDQLVPLVRKTLRVFIVIVAGLFIADNVFEWNVGSLLAGLGIGGLAFALAAKDSLANLFGSAVIFADQPFAMGERVKICGHDGTVEEVGFRSTKIRTLQGHLVTIPNSTVANEAVENVGRRPTIRRVFNVGLTYDTPPDRMQRAVEILREMLEARKSSFPEEQPGRVFFSDFNADNLNILVYYWFGSADWWGYLEFTHDFNMELLRRFNAEGLEFAFPTQTLYLRPEGTVPGSAPDPHGAS